MRQLTQGDVADILQNVRWQRDLYRRVPELERLACTSSLITTSDRFITAYGERKASRNDYPELLRSVSNCFQETAATPLGTKLGLGADVSAMERAGKDLGRLQRAHRNLLLKLDGLSAR